MRLTKVCFLTLSCLMINTATANLDLELDCGKRVESFSYLVDYSGSMMQTPNQDNHSLEKQNKDRQDKRVNDKKTKEPKGLMTAEEYEKTPKIVTVRRLLDTIHERIPLQEFQSALYTVSPYSEVLAYGQHKPDHFSASINYLHENMEVMGRRTSLGIAFQSHGQTMIDKKDKGTLFLITDGKVNRGRSVVSTDETKREADSNENKDKSALMHFYEKHPDVCISVISLADSEEGQAMVDSIARSSACSQAVTLRDLVTNNQLLEAFIADSLYRECQKVLSLKGIRFAFDKYNIDQGSEKLLQEALVFINARPNQKFLIQGWTDWTGTNVYNDKLSQKRAKAVKEWLIRHGVDEQRISIEGKGKSFKFDNHTKEGRYNNRRIDFVF